MEMTPLAAHAFRTLFEGATGQRLVNSRRWRIETALQPVMRLRGAASLDELAGMITRPGGEALRIEVVEALLNHETSFFRDAGVYRLLGENVLPALADARRADGTRGLRVWSAGCSTGQEAFSVAMLTPRRRTNDLAMEILATDLSSIVIATARRGCYSQIEVQRGMPVGCLMTCFDNEGEMWRIKPALRENVRFAVHNLLDAPPPGKFDLIMCRNVMLYFSDSGRRAVLARLAAAIAPGGLLMLGAGETLLDQTDAFMPDPELRGFYRSTVSIG